jgi:hypothetical protein
MYGVRLFAAVPAAFSLLLIIRLLQQAPMGSV